MILKTRYKNFARVYRIFRKCSTRMLQQRRHCIYNYYIIFYNRSRVPYGHEFNFLSRRPRAKVFIILLLSRTATARCRANCTSFGSTDRLSCSSSHRSRTQNRIELSAYVRSADKRGYRKNKRFSVRFKMLENS